MEREPGEVGEVDRRPEENIILWSWTRHRHYREKYGAMSEDGTWEHLHVIRLRSRREVRRFVDGLISVNDPI